MCPEESKIEAQKPGPMAFTPPTTNIGTERPGKNPEEPPNGGRRAWMVTFGGFAAQMCTFGYITSFGVYQTYYAANFLSDRPPSDISWIGSLQAFFLYLFGILSGPLSDRVGVKAVIIPAGLTLVFSVMMTSLSTQYYQFILTQGILGGIASGMVFTPTISCAGQYFTTLRATAMGIVISGAAIGGVIFPILLNELLTRTGNFGWSVRAVGFIMLLLQIYAAVASKEFAPRRTKKLFLPEAFKGWAYVLANVGFLIGLLGSYTPMFYAGEYALYRGMGGKMAVYQVAVLNAGSFAGRIVLSFVGDKVGRFNMNVVVYGVNAVLCFCWTRTETTGGIVGWVVMYGFWSGAIFSLFSPTLAQVCPNPGDIATYVGQGLAVCSLGALTGSPINGVLIRNYGYLAASMFSAGALFIAGCFFAAARFTLDRRLFVVI